MLIMPTKNLFTLCSTALIFPLLLAGAGFSSARRARAEDPQVEFDKRIKPLLTQYCVSCHNAKNSQAGVNIGDVKTVSALQKDQTSWRKILNRITDRSMPPAGLPKPNAEQHLQIISWLKTTLDIAAPGAYAQNPGRVLIHRLNRLEYNNTIRDLLGVDTHPADSFPADGGGGGGFDNNADTLFIPPILMERYLETASELLERAKPERLFVVKPSKSLPALAAEKRILERFASLAFRRPAEPSEVSRLMALYSLSRKQGDSFESATKQALKAVLVSPNFLFRIEKERVSPPKQTPASSPLKKEQPLNDYELANRLSYFLWASMPDDELFKLAREKRLTLPGTFERQIARMLKNEKSRSFSESFTSQWLKTRDLYTNAKPDSGRFPAFTPALRDAMYQEPVALFDSVMKEDASLLKLIDADYTFLNEELAKHYGIEGVSGAEMRRVKLADRKRGGVLTMASVLTLTSFPQRTSPVLRGKWVMEQVLGTPPPPPPPVVATLSSDDAPKDGLSFRQRLELHRKKPECAGCHARMDPLGFGLENFDATGHWRDTIGGAKVDSSGVLTSGEKFSGPSELKTNLLKQKEEFVRNLSEKMLAYALGRGLEPYDLPAIRSISASVLKNDCRSEILIQEIVKSYPFRFKAQDGG